MASPSGRWCEAMTNRRPRLIVSISSAGGCERGMDWSVFNRCLICGSRWIVALHGGGVLAVDDGVHLRPGYGGRVDDLRTLDGSRRVVGVNLLDDLFDAILRRHRLIEGEFHLRRAAQAHA